MHWLRRGAARCCCEFPPTAWYLGVIVDAPDTEVFAYELALMYQPTSDVMTIPSYAIFVVFPPARRKSP
jgi:hypothetical protein